MGSRPVSSDLIPEALAEALGQVVAQARREWERELELLRAERRALVAEIRLAALGGTTEQPAAADTAKATPAVAPVAKPAKSGSRS